MEVMDKLVGRWWAIGAYLMGGVITEAAQR